MLRKQKKKNKKQNMQTGYSNLNHYLSKSSPVNSSGLSSYKHIAFNYKAEENPQTDFVLVYKQKIQSLCSRKLMKV